MFREVARPVGGWSTGTTAGAELERALEVAKFDPKPRERRDRVHDESAAVAGMVISFVGIGTGLDCAIYADRVGDPLILSPGMGLAHASPGLRVAEGTAW